MVYDTTINFTEKQDRIDDVTFASPIAFRLLIDSVRFPNVQFTVQTAAIPSISVEPATYPTPQRAIAVGGDKVEYDPFNCTFLIDEELRNYREIHDWLIGLALEPEDRSIQKTRDMSLLVLDSNNNVIREIKFVDAYPTSLSTLDFDVKNTSVDYLVGEVSFNYSYFKVQ